MFLLAAALSTALASPHLTATTNLPQAQAAIDRGLFLYYAYNGDDAGRAFAEAAQLDPRLALAYWGIALASGPDLNTPITQERFTKAAHAIRKAVASEGGASPQERRLIDAMALRYKGTFADWGADDAAYRAAMSTLAASSRDENAKLLLAEALLEHGGLTWQDGRLADNGSQRALALVDGVLRNDPSSVMANHLCIHLYDLAPDRSPARLCAQRLDATNFHPEAEHLAHMPAHYWIETGDYAAALRSSERAYALVQQLAQDAPSDHTERYGKHGVAVGYSAAMMLGSYATARRWSERMTAVFGTSFAALTALRFGRYQAAFVPDRNEVADASVRGMAAIHLGDVNAARALAKHVAGNQMQGYLAPLFLAELAATQGNLGDAQRWIERARANQAAVSGGEMIPIIPADELLGAIYLRSGDSAGAVAAFTAALSAYPNDARALYGLAQAQAARGEAAQSSATRLRFDQQWKNADTAAAQALP